MRELLGEEVAGRERSALAGPDLHQSQFARLDLMLDGLFGAAQCLGGICQANPASWSIRHHARDDLVGHVDPLRRLSHDLVVLERGFPSPAANCVRADAKHFGCLVDAHPCRITALR